MAAAATSSLPPPNIVFVLVDDWGSYDAGFRERELGRPSVLSTPNIDRLTKDGVVLSNYYTQHICSPTRTSLLSGRYQIHTGLQDGIIQAWARVCLPPKFGTVSDGLKKLGYRTSMVGKWHAGIYQSACLPWRRGFDRYYGYLTGSEHHYTKIQRIARGSPTNASHLIYYPDLRTESGPVVSHCIAPPLAPPPPPPPPCGGGAEPTCNYTRASGYLPAGGDARPPSNLTLAAAKRACDASAACEALTLHAEPAECEASPCKVYFKSSAEGLTPADGWATLFKHPQPPSAQGDPSCYSTTMFVQRAVEEIRAHDAADAAHPLFLYLALQDVHEPIEVPARFSDPFAGRIIDGVRRTYAGMVSAVDEAVGNVSAALRAQGMWETGLLVVSSDNGGWMGYGGLNTPLRGHKTTYWEGGIKSIGIVVAPGRIAPGGSRFAGLAHVTDWLPTLVSAAGGSAGALGPAFAGLDGHDLWPSLAAAGGAVAAAGPRTELLVNIEGVGGSGAAVLRVGDYKLMRRMQPARGFDGWCDACNDPAGCHVPPGAGPGADPKGPGQNVSLGGQLCCWAPSVANATACGPFHGPRAPLPDTLLYDVAADPAELHDLAPAMPERVADLMRRLDAYNATNVPCCICTGSGRTSEMDRPPRDGFWYSFADQSPNPDPNCKLQREPPGATEWDLEWDP